MRACISHVYNGGIIQPGKHFFFKIGLVLYQPAKDQFLIGIDRYLDSFMCPFVRMNSSEIQQIITFTLTQVKLLLVKSVIYSIKVLEFRMPVAITNRNIMGARIVFLIYGNDLF